MMISQRPMFRRCIRSSGAAPGSLHTRRPVVLRAQQQDERAVEAGRRDFLSLVGLLTGLSAAQAARAADPYEELKALSEARTGSGSLLESFQATKGSPVNTSRTSRGIREKLAAEAAPQAKSQGLKLFGSNTSSSSGPMPSAPAAAAPKPKPFSAPVGPKPTQRTSPPAPKPAATAAAGGNTGGAGVSLGGLASGPLLQAAGVLGLVGVGASVATSAATSKPKDRPASPAAARAATPAPAKGTGKVQTGAAAAAGGSSTGKVLAGAAAAAAKSATGKVSVARSASPAAAASARPATPAGAGSRAATPSLRSATGKVTKGAAVAAASGSQVKSVVKQALVNEESPDQPTDFATGGFLGFVGLLAAFLLFGLPQPQVVAPTSSTTSDPLVEEAKRAALVAAAPSYTTPLYKAADAPAAADRRAISVTPPAAPAKAPAAPVAPVLPPKPAAVEAPSRPAPAAPAPAPAPAPVVKAEAPKVVVEAPKPAAVLKAEAPAKPAAAPAAPKAAPAAPAAASKAQEGGSAAEGPSAAQNLLLAAGGLAVVVTVFALTGSSSDSGSGEGAAAGATSTPAAAGAAGGDGSGAAAAATVAPAAEGVSAAASAAAASAAPADATQQGNAVYDQIVLALMSDPEVTEDLFSVMSSGDASLRNIPALAWSLVSTPTNAERLDGFAFQKLSTQRYQRVRDLLLGAGLALPDSPKIQPGAAATLAPAGDVDSSEVDPEKLRGVFEALLANPASRTLMRQLLKGAGMPFNEEAFEEQVKDSNYFNLAIAPILRSMPRQKLRVLVELQDPEKLSQLVSSVSTLAQDDQQLQAVTAELSSDVKQTVNTIREAEQRAASTTPQ